MLSGQAGGPTRCKCWGKPLIEASPEPALGTTRAAPGSQQQPSEVHGSCWGAGGHQHPQLHGPSPPCLLLTQQQAERQLRAVRGHRRHLLHREPELDPADRPVLLADQGGQVAPGRGRGKGVLANRGEAPGLMEPAVPPPASPCTAAPSPAPTAARPSWTAAPRCWPAPAAAWATSSTRWGPGAAPAAW